MKMINDENSMMIMIINDDDCRMKKIINDCAMKM